VYVLQKNTRFAENLLGCHSYAARDRAGAPARLLPVGGAGDPPTLPLLPRPTALQLTQNIEEAFRTGLLFVVFSVTSGL